MKNIKEVIIGVFAVIGFGAIVTGFTNEISEEHSETLSLQTQNNWILQLDAGGFGGFFYNTTTGEIKAVESNSKEMRFSKLKFRVVPPEQEPYQD